MKTKTCTICKKRRLVRNFNKKSASKDGLQNFCRECNRKSARRYYHDNKDKHIGECKKIHNKIYKRNSEFLQCVKKKYGCVNCHETEPCCLDFHHITNKSFIVSVAPSRGFRLQKLKDEINKCVCVCSNCHRKIHAGIICGKDLVVCKV